MADLKKAHQLHNEGIGHYRAGDYADALETLEQAQALFAEAGHSKKQGEVLNDRGVVLTQMNEGQKALELLQEALAIRREIGDRSGEGITLGNLGALFEQQGETDKALDAYGQAQAIFAELGEKGNEKSIAHQMSKLKLKKGKVLGAVTSFEHELDAEETPTGAQKVAKGLFRFWDQLFGVGAPPMAGDDDDWDQDDDDEWDDDDDWDQDDDDDWGEAASPIPGATGRAGADDNENESAEEE